MNIKEEEKNELELRMYFFVPYNISEIQKGIQAGHAAMEYARRFGETNLFVDFANNWKTFIILNGGTTNNHHDSLGTLQEIYLEIINYNIKQIDDRIDEASFKEPDLNDAMTSFCFIADERVFNYDDFPPFPKWVHSQEIDATTRSFINRAFIAPTTSDEESQYLLPEYYDKWIEEVIGGEKNLFLRTLLKGKKLA